MSDLMTKISRSAIKGGGGGEEVGSALSQPKFAN